MRCPVCNVKARAAKVETVGDMAKIKWICVNPRCPKCRTFIGETEKTLKYPK